ncbi:MAG: PEP-CTERM sorting domain-containing protein [Bryobacterales bacterium]|jgi:hypothetical protein|nr:PEP-CTERM sorting domain-containing protein [Bryobacterales bacterium]
MKLRALLIAVVGTLLMASTGSAGMVEFTAADPDLVSDLTVSIQVEDIVGGVKISANVVGGANDQIGDLIGLHFRVGAAPESVVISSVTANDMTPFAPPIAYSRTSNAMNPYTFNMNFFVIGDNGIPGKGWDIQVVMFNVGAGTLQASDFTAAGARLTSVGKVDGRRGDSLKLIDTVPGTPNVEEVPEPSTWLLLSAGLGLLALARRRREA